MLGCWGVAEPDQVIRTDLDNELEREWRFLVQTGGHNR